MCYDNVRYDAEDALNELVRHGWLQGHDSAEGGCYGSSTAEGAKCLGLALEHAAPRIGAGYRLREAVARQITRAHPDRVAQAKNPVRTIIDFNDHPDTEFADVRRVLEAVR